MRDREVQRALRHFGANVRRHRLRKRMTQGDLAEMVGVEPLFIRVLERAQRAPSFATLVRLLVALGVDASDLFTPAELQPNPRGRPRDRRRSGAS